MPVGACFFICREELVGRNEMNEKNKYAIEEGIVVMSVPFIVSGVLVLVYILFFASFIIKAEKNEMKIKNFLTEKYVNGFTKKF